MAVDRSEDYGPVEILGFPLSSYSYDYDYELPLPQICLSSGSTWSAGGSVVGPAAAVLAAGTAELDVAEAGAGVFDAVALDSVFVMASAAVSAVERVVEPVKGPVVVPAAGPVNAPVAALASVAFVPDEMSVAALPVVVPAAGPVRVPVSPLVFVAFAADGVGFAALLVAPDVAPLAVPLVPVAALTMKHWTA